MNGFKDSFRAPKDFGEEIKGVGEAAWTAQQTCSRLAEDTIDRLGRMEQRIGEIARTRGEGNSDELEERRSSDLMKKYLDTQRALQLQMKEFSIALKRMELLDGSSLSPHKPHQSMPAVSEKKGREEGSSSPRFGVEDGGAAPKRSTSVPHVRRPVKPQKGRSASSSNTPPLKSPASPIHPSTVKSRAMDASIKKKLKDLKAKEKSSQSFSKSPDPKPKRHRKLEARRNDRLDQLYKEYTAKYQPAQS